TGRGRPPGSVRLRDRESAGGGTGHGPPRPCAPGFSGGSGAGRGRTERLGGGRHVARRPGPCAASESLLVTARSLSPTAHCAGGPGRVPPAYDATPVPVRGGGGAG